MKSLSLGDNKKETNNVYDKNYKKKKIGCKKTLESYTLYIEPKGSIT